MPHIIDVNKAHHGEDGLFVTKSYGEQARGVSLTRTQNAATQLRADSRLSLEYQIKADHPTAVSATVTGGVLVSATLSDDTVVNTFPKASDEPDLAQMSVIGISDTSVEIPLDRTFPVSAYVNRVTAEFEFQMSDPDGSDNLWRVGSETIDITDILANMPGQKLHLNEPKDMQDDYELRDGIYYAAENAGLISPPEGCAFDVYVDDEGFGAFAAERIALEATEEDPS
jgi:hypothetical protein